MPSKPRPREDKAPRVRCAYIEDKKRCRAAGAGNPPLCDPHRLVIEAEAARAHANPFAKVVGEFLSGRVRRDTVRAAAGTLLGGLLIELENMPVFSSGPLPFARRHGAPRTPIDAMPDWARPFGGAPHGARRSPPVDPAAEAKKRELAEARMVLGFDNTQPLDEVTIQRRRKELARKHHPDRGGSEERMRRINAAADVLLAALA